MNSQKNGYNVLMPLIDANKYDFVVEKDGQFHRVQVKTTCRRPYYGTDGYVVGIHGTGGLNRSKNEYRRVPFEKNDYDFLFIVTEQGDCWNIPSEAITGRLEVTVGTSKYAEYKI